MGRGPVVAGRKASKDAARGKISAVHAKLIAVAARAGGNPDDNPSLRDAIEKARKDSVGKDVIDRAIKRGTGEDKDAAEIVEVMYEGYGPGGVAVIAKALTDNRNRTAASVRSMFTKNGGNLGETGSISSHMFDLRGVIQTSGEGEEQEMLIMDSGAMDYEAGGGGFRVLTTREDLSPVKQSLESSGVQVESSGLEYLPNMENEITDFDQALKTIKLLDDLDADEDIEKFWTNAVVDDILQQEVEAFIEKHPFHS